MINNNIIEGIGSIHNIKVRLTEEDKAAIIIKLEIKKI
jgi:hypothetical protein